MATVTNDPFDNRHHRGRRRDVTAKPIHKAKEYNHQSPRLLCSMETNSWFVSTRELRHHWSKQDELSTDERKQVKWKTIKTKEQKPLAYGSDGSRTKKCQQHFKIPIPSRSSLEIHQNNARQSQCKAIPMQFPQCKPIPSGLFVFTIGNKWRKPKAKHPTKPSFKKLELNCKKQTDNDRKRANEVD